MNEGAERAAGSAALWHSQDRHVGRLEWGLTGARSVVSYAAQRGSAVVAVVVDVLSFTTCVSVALDVGNVVHPYRWRDDGAAQLARRVGGTVAVSRDVAVREGGISLSPKSIREAGAVGPIVLPSPNGSTITAALDELGVTVVAAGMRNRAAVGAWLGRWLRSVRGAVPAIAFVPAGELWPDGSLRPAAEDLWGAGSVAAVLVEQLDHQAGPLLLSPEARIAVDAWTGVRDRLTEALTACASGRELVEQGYSDDVAIAAELDASTVVPVLTNGAFAASPL
jgi:2-phosphosulfolactate phosphatase